MIGSGCGVPPLKDAWSQVPWMAVGRWAAVVLLLAVVIAVLRARTGRNGRRRRLEYALLPDPEFETTPEAVIRFAAQMGRVDERRVCCTVRIANSDSTPSAISGGRTVPYVDRGTCRDSPRAATCHVPGRRNSIHQRSRRCSHRSVDRYRKRSS